MTDPVDPENHPSDSAVQRRAEEVLLGLLAARWNTTLVSKRVHLPNGSYVDIDGVSREPHLLVEVWAHQGPPKGAQTKKVLVDALKLSHVARTLTDTAWRLLLLFSDEEAAKPFRGRSWYAGALRDLGIEIHVVELPEALKGEIRAAQVRQYR